jgi:hypothetical protein
MLGTLAVIIKASIVGLVRGLKEAISVTQSSAKNINQAANSMNESLSNAFSGQLRSNITSLSESISLTKEAIIRAKSELKAFQEQLKTQKEGTKEFKATSDAIKRTKKELFELNLELSEFNVQARNQKKGLADSRLAAEDASSAMEATSRVVNAASNALLLFNSSSESTKGALKILTIAMSAISAAVAIQNLRLRENTIFMGLASRASQVYTAATTGANAATIAFKTTLLTLGVGAVLLALGYLAEKFSQVASAADEAEKRVARLKNRFEEYDEFIKDQIKAVERQVEIDEKQAKLAKKSDDEILKIKQDGYDKQIKLLKDLQKEGDVLADRLFKREIKSGTELAVAQQKRRLFEKDFAKKISDQILEIENKKVNAELDFQLSALSASEKIAKKKKDVKVKEAKNTFQDEQELQIKEELLNRERLLFLEKDELARAKIINDSEQRILGIKQSGLLQQANDQNLSSEGLKSAINQLALDRIKAEQDAQKRIQDIKDKQADYDEKLANDINSDIKQANEQRIKDQETLYQVLRTAASKEYREDTSKFQEYQAKIKELEIQFLQERIELKKKLNQDVFQEEQALTDLMLEETERRNKILTKEEMAFAKRISRIFEQELRQLALTILNAIQDTLVNAFAGVSESSKLEVEILKEQQRELEQSMKEQTKSQLQMLQERKQYVENEKKLAEATQSGLSKLFNTILEGVADFLAQLGTGLVAAAIASDKFQQYLLKNPKLAAAAGVAAIAASIGVRTLLARGPKFANGGIVSGPTLGLVGEYPGASTNPEVIAPLDKLKSLIGDTGNGGNGFIAETRISGRDLAIVLNRYNQDLKRG